MVAPCSLGVIAKVVRYEIEDLRKIKTVYPVYTLCRDYERSGFIEGIKIGTLLQAELTEG